MQWGTDLVLLRANGDTTHQNTLLWWSSGDSRKQPTAYHLRASPTPEEKRKMMAQSRTRHLDVVITSSNTGSSRGKHQDGFHWRTMITSHDGLPTTQVPHCDRMIIRTRQYERLIGGNRWHTPNIILECIENWKLFRDNIHHKRMSGELVRTEIMTV